MNAKFHRFNTRYNYFLSTHLLLFPLKAVCPGTQDLVGFVPNSQPAAWHKDRTQH